MIAIPILLFLAVVIVDRLYRFTLNTIVRDHQFRLYRLRDELREATMEGKIDPRNWVFQYLDSSIAKTITVLDEINLWRALAGALFYRRDERFMEAQQHLERELAKPKNALLAQFRNKYALSIGGFIYDRHPCVKLLLSPIFKAQAVGGDLRAKWQETLKYQTEAPETSTLLDCKAA